MRKDLLSYPAFFILLFLPLTILAQTTQPDSGFVKHSVVNAVQTYRDAVGMQAQLYTGSEYHVPAKPYLEGHQFFKVKSIERGTVHYNKAWFYDVPMLYDLMIDEVVTVHPPSGFYQKLVKEKVDTFLLNEHVFIRLELDSTTASMRPGFYDLLYSGKVKALAKRTKDLQERTTVNGREGSYNEINRFYIWKDGVYHQVSSKGSVLKVLRDQKKELNKFARANKLKFNNRREESILKLTRHYDTLTQ